jgi:glutamyl endopeptidase
MVQLKTVSKPAEQQVRGGLEAAEAEAAAPPRTTRGSQGSASGEYSRSLRYLVGKGTSAPIQRTGAISALESVLGPTDDRVRILDTDLAPWRMICALRMAGGNGGGAIGTGWLVGPRTLLTAGHCVHSTQFFGGWASRVQVMPGRNGADTPFGSAESRRFSSVDAWVEREDPDFDIGCIHLDEPVGDGVGWFAVGALSAEQLEGFLVNVSGYPGDRGAGTEQYFHRNRILRVTERRIFYDVDTFGGQSGAPAWIHQAEGEPPLAVGIHAYGVGGTPTSLGIEANSAPRIIPEVFDQIQAWIDQDGAQA